MIALLLFLAQAPPCGSCHEDVVKKHATSNHALALRKAAGTQAARRFESSEINERNGAAFTYRAAGDALAVTAELGGENASAPLEWLFGAGAQGQTPVGRLPDGRYFEHRLSYYPPLDRVARTFGHPPGVSFSPEAALGLVNDNSTITRCFQCHANNVKPGPDLTRMTVVLGNLILTPDRPGSTAFLVFERSPLDFTRPAPSADNTLSAMPIGSRARPR